MVLLGVARAAGAQGCGPIRPGPRIAAVREAFAWWLARRNIGLPERPIEYVGAVPLDSSTGLTVEVAVSERTPGGSLVGLADRDSLCAFNMVSTDWGTVDPGDDASEIWSAGVARLYPALRVATVQEALRIAYAALTYGTGALVDSTQIKVEVTWSFGWNVRGDLIRGGHRMVFIRVYPDGKLGKLFIQEPADSAAVHFR